MERVIECLLIVLMLFMLLILPDIYFLILELSEADRLGGTKEDFFSPSISFEKMY